MIEDSFVNVIYKGLFIKYSSLTISCWHLVLDTGLSYSPKRFLLKFIEYRFETLAIQKINLNMFNMFMTLKTILYFRYLRQVHTMFPYIHYFKLRAYFGKFVGHFNFHLSNWNLKHFSFSVFLWKSHFRIYTTTLSRVHKFEA